MNFDEYCQNYDEFHSEFFDTATPQDKAEKLIDESIEFITAYKFGTDDEKIDEAIDVMNTSIAYLRSMNITNPLFVGSIKLAKTAEKYRYKNGLL